MNKWAWLIVGLVAAQRLAELVYAERNTRALLAKGAVEVGRAHYPLIVAVHLTWLVAIVLMWPKPAPIYWLPLAAFFVLQCLRVWVLATLGPYWTTRILTLPEAPLVTGGPYRFIRHPNYAVVIGEIAMLPLVFGEWIVALVFSILNAIVLIIRIREEERALAPRRAPVAQ